MESIQRIGDWFVNEYRKNGLKWLNGVKYTSMVASPILAAFGAVRAYKEMEKRKKEGELSLKDKAVIVAKNEAVAFTSMVGGIAASAKVDHDMKQTIDALTTMVVLGENKIRELKEAEKEVVGEEKREEIQKKADEKAVQNIDTKGILCDPMRGIYPTFDTMTGQLFPSSEAKIQAAINYVNRNVNLGDNVLFGQFLQECGGIWYLGTDEVCTVGSDYCWPASRIDIYDVTVSSLKDKNGQLFYAILYPEGCGLTPVNDLPWRIEN